MTRNELNEFGTVYKLGYCEAETVIRCLCLRGQAIKVGYNYGYYGWNWDGYIIVDNGDRAVVCTGYRPFGAEPADRVGLKTLEKKAPGKKGDITAKKLIKLLRGH